MMVDQIETAGCSHGMQLVVGKHLSEMFARGATGAIELIVGVIHLVAAHNGFEAAFVEGAVVGHERQPFDKWLNLLPDVGKHGRILSVGLGDAMDECVPIKVVIWLRLDKGIERVHKLAFANDDYTHATHAGALVVGGLEVYGGEGVHVVLGFHLKSNAKVSFFAFFTYFCPKLC